MIYLSLKTLSVVTNTHLNSDIKEGQKLQKQYSMLENSTFNSICLNAAGLLQFY